MNNITKKIIVYVIVGALQIGLGASVIEASPQYKGLAAMQQQDDDQDRHEAERIENERHERAMERRPNESDREWEERQNRENERHERNLARIAHTIWG